MYLGRGEELLGTGSEMERKTGRQVAKTDREVGAELSGREAWRLSMHSNDHKGRINQGCHWELSVRKTV